jgi:hypothetical protein
MQQTSVDHYLKKKFVYRYEIFCNRIPSSLPPNVLLTTGDDSNHGKWGHLLICGNEDAYQNSIALLRSNRILFFPTISEREGVVGHLLNPQSPNLSFTWNSLWGGLRVALTSALGGFLPRIAPLGALEGLRSLVSAVKFARW